MELLTACLKTRYKTAFPAATAFSRRLTAASAASALAFSASNAAFTPPLLFAFLPLGFFALPVQENNKRIQRKNGDFNFMCGSSCNCIDQENGTVYLSSHPPLPASLHPLLVHLHLVQRQLVRMTYVELQPKNAPLAGAKQPHPAAENKQSINHDKCYNK